eukprot:6458780-Amphidinium_carterae.1
MFAAHGFWVSPSVDSRFRFILTSDFRFLGDISVLRESHPETTVRFRVPFITLSASVAADSAWCTRITS